MLAIGAIEPVPKILPGANSVGRMAAANSSKSGWLSVPSRAADATRRPGCGRSILPPPGGGLRITRSPARPELSYETAGVGNRMRRFSASAGSSVASLVGRSHRTRPTRIRATRVSGTRHR